MLLLDTDVMIDVLRRHPPAMMWLASLGNEPLLLPGFVVIELGLPLQTFNQKHYAPVTILTTAQPSTR